MDSKKQRIRIWNASSVGALHGFPMRLREFVKTHKKPRKYTKLAVTIALPVVATGVSAAYIVGFNTTQNLSYGFSATESCIDTSVVMPNLHSYTSKSSAFTVTPRNTTQFFGRDVLAKQLCFTAVEEPSANTLYSFNVANNLLGFVDKEVRLVSESQPQIVDSLDDGKTVPIGGSLQFGLDDTQTNFNYRIVANGNSSNCDPQSAESTLDCDIKPLELKQSQQYSFMLMRSFASFEQETSIFNSVYKTAGAVKVVESSIKDEQLFYSKPTEAIITFNKSVEKLGAVTLTEKSSGQRQKITTNIKDKELVVEFDQDLPREQEFTLSIESAEAKDKGWMQEPYIISFFTSGGPKVAGHNLDGHSFGRSESIVLTFDSPLKKQDVSKYVSLSAAGSSVKASYSISGSSITINPTNSFETCESFTVEVSKGLVSTYSIVSDSTYNKKGRTSCYTTETVGTSHKGRGIYAYVFGNGPEVVMFTGGTHGNEPSSKYILDSLISDLNKDYSRIPKDTTVIVVPNINPDGISKGTRTNSKDIDLNRNFPANNWKSDIVMPGGKENEGGGGDEPLDQKESAAIANYTLAKNPKLVVNYHATGGLSISNGSGNSVSKAKKYASSVGYTYLTSQASNSVFDHDTTGAYSDWLHDKAGIPTVLIELWSYSGNEFTSHESAMWSMISD